MLIQESRKLPKELSVGILVYRTEKIPDDGLDLRLGVVEMSLRAHNHRHPRPAINSIQGPNSRREPCPKTIGL